MKTTQLLLTAVISFSVIACNTQPVKESKATTAKDSSKNKYLSQPLVTNIYTADPSAHVFDGKIYIYPSHDTATGIPEDDLGSHFNMMDFHVLSMDSIGGKVSDNGVALDIKNIPWAGRQLWAPDCALKDGKYYLYFPVKNKQNIFQIGVATSNKPTGPFVAENEAIKGSYSIDPCVFKDDNGDFYMYFGGIWGGQLQRWASNTIYDSTLGNRKATELAVLPRVAKLSKDMKQFAEPVKDVKIIDENGHLFTEKDNTKRFFEASWMFKKDGKYYFTYSTGDTHFINYAIGNNPYGPFTYKGIVLNPVQGWTNHQSIVEVKGKWYLFYHDIQLSGKTHLRNVKMTELKFNSDGTIQTVTAFK